MKLPTLRNVRVKMNSSYRVLFSRWITFSQWEETTSFTLLITSRTREISRRVYRLYCCQTSISAMFRLLSLSCLIVIASCETVFFREEFTGIVENVFLFFLLFIGQKTWLDNHSPPFDGRHAWLAFALGYFGVTLGLL